MREAKYGLPFSPPSLYFTLSLLDEIDIIHMRKREINQYWKEKGSWVPWSLGSF